MTPPADLAALARLSARIGADPLLIQGAGGNTSVKAGAVMWIKASGTLLADALARDIFVPVDLPAMREALTDVTRADRAGDFVLDGHSLRPSIETSLHAVFHHRVVVHVHCVNTLAHAIRSDAAEALGRKLSAFDWCLVPYAKPGANLAAMVAARLGPHTDVAVLRNHGLIVAADSVEAAEALLGRVVDAVRVTGPEKRIMRLSRLREMLRPGWIVPEGDIGNLHQLGWPERSEQAAAGSLYPDHVIFCGPAARIHKGGDLPDPADAPPFLIVPDCGVVMRADASPGAKALARCLGDVLVRVPPDAPLAYLTPGQEAELLDWDAEKYRQSLNG